MENMYQDEMPVLFIMKDFMTISGDEVDAMYLAVILKIWTPQA